MSHGLGNMPALSLEQPKWNRTSYLLTQEIPNFKFMPIFLDNAVDREVGVDCTHFV
jgi:hypothetical protein